MVPIGYIWSIDREWIGVVPGDAGSTVWTEWLYRQSASQRSLVKDDVDYWKLSSSLKEEVKRRFIVSGWMLEYRKPEKSRSSKGSPSISAPGVPIRDRYEALFLVEGAPRIVVDASYRALVKEYHPDRCHDGKERTTEINISKDEIYKSRGW